MSNEERLNVRDFGAKGDWFTDDTAAIQAAIDAAFAVGGGVFVPAGVYRLTNPLEGHGVPMQGEGQSSRLKWDAPEVEGE